MLTPKMRAVAPRSGYRGMPWAAVQSSMTGFKCYIDRMQLYTILRIASKNTAEQLGARTTVGMHEQHRDAIAVLPTDRLSRKRRLALRSSRDLAVGLPVSLRVSSPAARQPSPFWAQGICGPLPRAHAESNMASTPEGQSIRDAATTDVSATMTTTP